MKVSQNEIKDNILVGVRVRPPLEREITHNEFNNCVATHGNKVYVSLKDQPVILNSNSRDDEVPEGIAAYQFDQIYGPDKTTESVYQGSVKPAVDSVLSGFNATLFAYGQTGSGKTYTMEGVIPMVIQELIDSLTKNNPQFEMEQ